tara:strand:- start:1213 stop:1728 length:516 start_codon:yes stop_codon:yes gene_type:complete
MDVTVGTDYVEKNNAKNKVMVIKLDLDHSNVCTGVWYIPYTGAWSVLHVKSKLCEFDPLDIFNARYTLPEESAFIQQQWYQNDGTYLWVHSRVDFPDECIYLEFRGNNGHYTIEFLNVDAFRELLNSYTICMTADVPIENRKAKNNFERGFNPTSDTERPENPEQKTGLRF